MDLSSLTIAAKVHNLNTVNAVRFLSPSLSGLLESARITIGGVEVSSCDYLARTEHVMGILQTDDVRRADYASGFGMDEATAHGVFKTKAIPKSDSRDVVFRPRCLGILDMKSYLPVSMVPSGSLNLELTWTSSPTSCCDTSNNKSQTSL